MQNINNFNKNNLEEIAIYLKKSNIAILPSDTLYGIAAAAYDEDAINKVFALKERSFSKKLPIHYANIKMIEQDIHLNEEITKLCKAFLPGKLTIIGKKKQNSKLKLVEETVAFRIPNNTLTLKIIELLNEPITMPSANKSGITPSFKLSEIQQDLNIPGLEDDANISCKASTIFDSINMKIIREGEITNQQIAKVLNIK